MTNRDQLLRQADQAMYQAKTAGKNRYVIFDHSVDLLIQEQARWDHAVHEAMTHDQFLLHYQPKVELQTGKIISVEALLRWQHPTRGLLEPRQFLPRIHTKQQAVELGQWVLQSVLQQLSVWQQQSFFISVSFNAGPRWLQSDLFFAQLNKQLVQYPNVNPELLDIEILETSAIDDLDRVKKVIHRCQQLGVSFILDDFGTGYSSMNYLKNLPIKSVKVDQSFIKDITNNLNDQKILKAILDIASVSGKTVIAEGVETKAIAKQLTHLSCYYGQGFAFGKPMPAAQVRSMVDKAHIA